MWLLWINQAQQHLVADVEPAPAPVVEDVEEDFLEVVEVADVPVQEPAAAARAVRDVPVMVFQEPQR
ncbi:hypothetical protein ACQPW3_19635 [Actinosynnema sp. CA-248983]